MSIYTTLWRLRFPAQGDWHTGCAWEELLVQAVPSHCGPAATEEVDPYADFLPPLPASIAQGYRAVVVVRATDSKQGQRYRAPLLILSAREYFDCSWETLTTRIAHALRGARPRVVAESQDATGVVTLFFEDGSASTIAASEREPQSL